MSQEKTVNQVQVVPLVQPVPEVYLACPVCPELRVTVVSLV